MVLAKFGLAKCGQIRMAKFGFAKFGRDLIVHHNVSPIKYFRCTTSPQDPLQDVWPCIHWIPIELKDWEVSDLKILSLGFIWLSTCRIVKYELKVQYWNFYTHGRWESLHKSRKFSDSKFQCQRIITTTSIHYIKFYCRQATTLWVAKARDRFQISGSWTTRSAPNGISICWCPCTLWHPIPFMKFSALRSLSIHDTLFHDVHDENFVMRAIAWPSLWYPISSWTRGLDMILHGHHVIFVFSRFSSIDVFPSLVYISLISVSLIPSSLFG